MPTSEQFQPELLSPWLPGLQINVSEEALTPDRGIAAGHLVGMVLLEHLQPVQHRIRLGERQHRRVPRGDGLHLGVGQLLGTDVLRLRTVLSPVRTWAMNRALVSRACQR